MPVQLSRAAAALAVAAGLAFGAAALAQAPAPKAADPALADLAKEQQQQQQKQPLNNQPVWKEIRAGQPQYSATVGRETNVLIQPQGQWWRAMRNGEMSVYGGWALVAVFLAIGFFYWWRGPIELHEPLSGRKIRRFSDWERMVHWSTAGTFTLLSLSGLVILFGKNLLLPLIGYTLFSWLATIAKNLHNLVGPLFVVSVVLLFFTFVRQNFLNGQDFRWLSRFGGLLGDHQVPSGKFNGGEKVWFWVGALLIGWTLGATGLILDFPNFDQSRSTMQLANLVHLGAATLMIMGAMAHIYIGTIGMRHAIDGMKTGYVDETWAKEHHELWYDDVKAGRVPADTRDAPAPLRERAA